MSRYAPKTTRKYVGALSTSAQTFEIILENVAGRRIEALQFEFEITNGATVPTYSTDSTAPDPTCGNFSDLISEVRVLASDYARPTETAFRKLSGKQMLLWELAQNCGIDPDALTLITTSGDASATYNPSLFLYFAHPNLEDPAGNRACLPLNLPAGRTGEGVGYVTDKVKIQIDTRSLTAANANVYSANAPSSVKLWITYHERWMPADAPYIATELVSQAVSLAGWTAGGTEPEPFIIRGDGWLLDALMEFKVSSARSNAIFSDSNGKLLFKRGSQETLEEWSLASLRAFNARELGVLMPSWSTADPATAPAYTIGNLAKANLPAGVVHRDWLFNRQRSLALEPAGVRSLYPINQGELPQIQPFNLAANVSMTFLAHKAFVQDIRKLVSL